MLALAAFAGLGMLMVRSAARDAAATHDRWEAVAGRAGLTCIGRFPNLRLRGRRRGVDVEAHLAWQRTGGNGSTPVCVVRVVLPGDLAGVSLRRGGLRGALEGALHPWPRVRTGDPVFDEAFAVFSADEERALAGLTPTLRAALLSARDEMGELSADAGLLAASWRGHPTEAELEARLERVATVFAPTGPR